MGVTYGFYNSVNHDRRYDAFQVGRMFDGLITDGVFLTISAGKNILPFNCTKAVDPAYITVDIGKAWFHNTWLWNDSKINLKCDLAASSSSGPFKTHALVIEIDYEKRINSLKIISENSTHATQRTGESLKPFAGSFGEIKQGVLWRYPLFIFEVSNGVTGSIKSWIGIDGKCPVCAPVPPMVSFSLDDYLNGLKTDINNYFNNIQSQFNSLLNQLQNLSSGGLVTTQNNGLVPKLPGNSTYYFAGDGTWKKLPDANQLGTTYSLATTAADGLLRKLNGKANTYMNGNGQWTDPSAWNIIRPDNTAYGEGQHWYGDEINAASEASIAGGGGKRRVTIPYGAWEIIITIEFRPSLAGAGSDSDCEFTAIIPNKPTTTITSESGSPPITNIAAKQIVPGIFSYYYDDMWHGCVGFVILKKYDTAQSDRRFMLLNNWTKMKANGPDIIANDALRNMRVIIRWR